MENGIKDEATNMLSTLMSAMVWTLDDFHGYYLGSNKTYELLDFLIIAVENACMCVSCQWWDNLSRFSFNLFILIHKILK